MFISSITNKPIAITPGEPAGIGPDIVCDLVTKWRGSPIVVVANPTLMAERAALLGYAWNVPLYDSTQTQSISVLPVECPNPKVTPGQLNTAHASYVINTLKAATQGCLDGHFSALVTGPIHKGVICDAGIPFTGHTDWLAEYSHTKSVLMTFLNPVIPCALLTTHVPLKTVTHHISQERIHSAMQLLHDFLTTHHAIQSPNIGVAGINPHAGENGHLGDEENHILLPALKKCRAHGIHCSDPIPADTLFTPNVRKNYDAILSMYHDQGLPVIKALAFGDITQTTLGLPFLRVSVDHGTALSIAGSGKAKANSLHLAVNDALRLLSSSSEQSILNRSRS